MGYAVLQYYASKRILVEDVAVGEWPRVQEPPAAAHVTRYDCIDAQLGAHVWQKLLAYLAACPRYKISRRVCDRVSGRACPCLQVPSYKKTCSAAQQQSMTTPYSNAKGSRRDDSKHS